MKLSHVWSWTKILTGYFSLQLLVQAISAVVGIIIVRTVDKHEYAFYTVSNAFLSAASNLTDCGVAAALSAIGGKIWHDRVAFGSLLNTAYGIRKWFVILTTIVVVAIFPVMLLHNGAGGLKISSLTIVLIVSLLFQFGGGIYVIVPQLKGDYKFMQRVTFLTTLLRMVLLALAWLTILNALTAILMNCAAFGLQTWFYKRYADSQVDVKAKQDMGMRRSILSIIRKQLPYEVYGVLSGQISIFLLTIFGTSSKVADIGALSRLAFIFSAMSTVLANIMVPRFARCQDKNRLSGLFWKIILTYFATVSSILVFVALFPNQIVLLLGHQYSDLGPECWLAVASGVTGAMLGAVWVMNSSRGWIIPAWIGLSVGLAAQIAGILAFNIHTVHGVLLMNLVPACAGLVLNLLASVRFLHNAKKTMGEHELHYTSQPS